MAKQIKVREDNYFAVQGWMVTELKLKGNALMLYAIIYGFSQTTNTAFTGSVDYLCEWLGGVSRPTVINTLDNLVKQGLLTKSNLKVEFSRNVPNNLTEIVDTVTKLDGKVDKETLLSLLPFIDNPKEVLEKLEADKERDRQSTDPYSTQNITEDSNNLFPNLNAQNSPQEALNAQGATIPQQEQ